MCNLSRPLKAMPYHKQGKCSQREMKYLHICSIAANTHKLIPTNSNTFVIFTCEIPPFNNSTVLFSETHFIGSDIFSIAIFCIHVHPVHSAVVLSLSLEMSWNAKVSTSSLVRRFEQLNVCPKVMFWWVPFSVKNLQRRGTRTCTRRNMAYCIW